MIVIASLRSAQTCCDRSNPLVTKELVVVLSMCESTMLWGHGVAATVRALLQEEARSVGGGVAEWSLVGNYCYRNLLSLTDECL